MAGRRQFYQGEVLAKSTALPTTDNRLINSSLQN